MSLRVWLPLDEDLHNQGISDLEFSNEDATKVIVDNNGKIGKCYTRSAIKTAGRIVSNKTILLNGDLSICCWAKVTATVGDTANGLVTNHSHADNTGFGLTVKQVGGEDYRISCNTGNGSSRTYCTYYGTTNIKNNWHHLTLTYNNTLHQFQLWVDGHVEVTQSYTNRAQADKIYIFDWSTTYNSASYRPACSLNDVRIYDHCLSAAEVKEIAQGLVLHYKLDDGLFGNPNLYTGSEKFTGSWNGSAAWATSSETYQNFVVKEKSTVWGGLSQNITCTQGDIFTISFWGKVESGGTIRSIHRSNLGNVTTGLTILDGNFMVMGDYWVRTTDNGTQWKRYWATLQISSSDVTYLQWRLENSTADKKFQICGIKLEKGNVATPWCPADSELDIDRTVIKDSSGYNHNGTIVGSVVPAADTVRYGISTHIDGAGVITATTPGADIRTLSCWVKTTKNKSTSQMLVADSASNMCISFYSGTIIGVFGTTRSTGSKCTLGTSYKENDWNHIVVVKTSDDGKRDIYCNGEKLTPAADDYWSATTGFFVGNRNGAVSGNTPFYGYISDVRAYCTPLLDTDIKQLYNVGMKVDKTQNIHNFELVEKGYNILAATPWCSSYSTHNPITSPFTNFNANGEVQFTANGSSAGTNYLEITPGIYEYDYTISVNTGNQFYIGFERYDADKTSRSNNACIYIYSTKSSTDVIKQRYKGTVNLSTDGTNPLKYMALRILNGWSGTTSGVTGQATIHNFSLRLQSTAINPKIIKEGQLIGDEFKEYLSTKFYKDHIIEANQFIER